MKRFLIASAAVLTVFVLSVFVFAAMASNDDKVDAAAREVVDQLGALVTEEPGVLEPGRTIHGPKATGASTAARR